MLPRFNAGEAGDRRILVLPCVSPSSVANSAIRCYRSQMSIHKVALGQHRVLIGVEAVVLVGVIGWLDYTTGWEWSFFVFYALPIVFVVWKGGRRWGFAFALLCSAVWCLAQFESNPYQTRTGFALAVATRLFYFSVLVIAAAAIKAQQKIDQTKIDSLERAQELEREILRISEREQQRIGRDLHDSLGSHLAAVGYAAADLTDELRQKARPEAGKAEHLREMVSEAISLTRGLARGIFPVQMDGSGLAMALEDFAQTTSHHSTLAVTFHETGSVVVADPEMGMHLFRIAQEAVNNAAKHARAANVTILLDQSESGIRLVIADDGEGMPPSAGPKGRGLESMAYRARVLGGVLAIKSQPEEGTVVTCEVPLQAPSSPPAIP